tara:strand:- start:20125 stop:20850 length:726 start_codon:yes stop_codon:yes gene_type:complete
MICAISQPTFFPWLGYFDLIDQVDNFIFYDDVQIEKQSWGVRNKIKSNHEFLYLTVSLLKINGFKECFYNNTLISKDFKWRNKQIKSIRQFYSKSDFFKENIDFIENLIISKSNFMLSDFNENIISKISERIGIQTKFKKSSSLKSKQGTKDNRLVQICSELNAEFYISPKGSFEYIEKNNKYGAFLNSNINLVYNDYNHPIYNQIGDNFISHLSIIDLLFNVGKDNCLKIIRSGRNHLNY